VLTKTSANSLSSPQSKRFLRWIALGGWIIIALLSMVLFFIDISNDYLQMLYPCEAELGRWGGCNFLAISPAEVTILSSWGWSLNTYAILMTLHSLLIYLAFIGLGLLILWQKGLNRIGLLVSLALIVSPFSVISGDTEWAAINPSLLYLGVIIATVTAIIQYVFLYLMPNGRFSPKWAPIPLAISLFLLITLTLHVNAVILLPDLAFTIVTRLIVGLIFVGIGLQIYRYFRDSNMGERQQTKWKLFGVVSYACSIIFWVLIFGGGLSIPSGMPRLLANLFGNYLILLAILVLPVAITIAILRYRLWNIDIILNRTLVYGGLTLMIVLIYMLVVGGLGLLFQGSGNFAVALIATGLIAVIFQPIRERLQNGVNRLMYGQRDDPYSVLSTLGQQLQTTAVPSETLNVIVQTIASSLKLPYAAIVLTENEEQIGQAFVGKPVGETVELPLRYQKETVGRLLVSPRAANEKFTPKEDQLLADIAAQTAPVASATRLTLALQHSREKLVLAREEERRRIRRDLHDGFGPTMASQTLKLDTVLELLMDDDPQTAVKYVMQLKEQTQQMVTDIRRLVYELYPSVLDELGLLEALRIHAAQMRGVNGFAISIEASPEQLPKLPAAIEVAAYRIVLEAVTNVVRHAHATQCQVWIEVENGRLQLTVSDDGIGFPTNLQRGVGLTSMRERAEELGGTFEIESNEEKGAWITAVLPFAQGDQT